MAGALQEGEQRLEIRAAVKAHAVAGSVTTGQFYGEFDTADNQFATDRSYTGILQFGEGWRARMGSPDAVGLPYKEHGFSGFCVTRLDAPGDKGFAVERKRRGDIVDIAVADAAKVQELALIRRRVAFAKNGQQFFVRIASGWPMVSFCRNAYLFVFLCRSITPTSPSITVACRVRAVKRVYRDVH